MYTTKKRYLKRGISYIQKESNIQKRDIYKKEIHVKRGIACTKREMYTKKRNVYKKEIYIKRRIAYTKKYIRTKKKEIYIKKRYMQREKSHDMCLSLLIFLFCICRFLEYFVYTKKNMYKKKKHIQ